jgi:hypothetical protein
LHGACAQYFVFRTGDVRAKPPTEDAIQKSARAKVTSSYFPALVAPHTHHRTHHTSAA